MSRTTAFPFIFHGVLVVAVSLSFAGCSTAPYRPPTQGATPSTSVPVPQPPAAAPLATDAGIAIAQRAQQLVGARYRYGGAGPDAFDCSGLVYYVHTALGIVVPRTAAEQKAAASPVKRAALQPGDLVFFRDSGPTITHVGVYTGDGVFVHAPKSGRNVSYASLYDDYYQENFAGAGRLYSVR
jgi:cell wall-associated NlpC family hydrolase